MYLSDNYVEILSSSLSFPEDFINVIKDDIDLSTEICGLISLLKISSKNADKKKVIFGKINTIKQKIKTQLDFSPLKEAYLNHYSFL